MRALSELNSAVNHALCKRSLLLGAYREASPECRRKTSQAGSTLIWVMVVILVLVIALGVGLTAASGQFSLSTTRHEQQQAYYTALSSTRTIADWLMAQNGDDTTKDSLLSQITAAGNNGINLVVNDLPAAVGTCVANLRYTDAEQTTLKISSTATFSGASETVSLTLMRAPKGEEVPDLGDFGLAEYDRRADQINKITSSGVVPVYETSTKVSNAGYNEKDLELLNNLIRNASSTREARWTNVLLTDTSTTNNNAVLGTQIFPINGTADTKTDTRRFMVPANGRITIDPQEGDGFTAAGSGEANNTRLVSLAIDNTDHKNVLFRLASNSAATAAPLVLPDASLWQRLYGTAYPYNNAPFQNRSTPRYASLLMLNFTGNNNSTSTLSYKVDGQNRNYTWHPNNWNGLDIFVQEETKSQVTTNLVLGPFGHKHAAYLDFYAWGNFVDNWNGTEPGEVKKLWPSLYNTTHQDGYGLPIFPVDYGENARFWILDGRSDRSFRVMQGVSIIEGSIYSNRSTIIGGALIRSGDKYTKDGLNQDIMGFANYDPTDHIMYVEATTRYSQLLYNTDIILKAPTDGKTASSEIRFPQNWRERDNRPQNESADKNKDMTHNPSMTIVGGTIYVGERQTLTIQGAKNYGGENNMWIAPDKIVVDKGGTLVINASSFYNVITDIYVAGGTLIVQPYAMIKGNIYVYNEGVLDMRGVFQLETVGANPSEQLRKGIFIYGPDTVGAPGVKAAGHLTLLSTLQMPYYINGDNGGPAGPVHLIGGTWANSVTSSNSTLPTPYNVSALLCDGYDTTTGRCPHYNEPPPVPDISSGGGSSGSDGSGGSDGWIVGSYGN
jgi:Tfp pilus assembly protein PilV